VALMEQEDIMRRSSSNLSGHDIENNLALPLRIPKFIVLPNEIFFVNHFYIGKTVYFLFQNRQH